MHPARPLVTLKCKLGELDSLRHLRSTSDAHVRLMIELLDSVKPGGKLLPALVRAAVNVANSRRTLWLDTTWLTAASPLAGQPGGVFEYLDDMIESALLKELGLMADALPGLVPVIAGGAPDDVLRRVRLLVEHGERDLVIRFRRALPASELANRIQAIMRLTGTRVGHVHVVLDVGFVEEVREPLVGAVAEAAAVVHDVLGPDSVTLLAGSIPAARTTYATTTRDRPEVFLWREVCRRVGMIGYGDYGVTHPIPRSGGNPRPPYPYLCYTVPRRTVVLRRRIEKGDVPAERFADLAEELVERDDFAGPDFSWGDRELALCRPSGGNTAGSVSRWVSMATSHHLEHVSRRTPANL
ncbi:beta family protein [Actinophytocola sediminis]